MAEQTHGGPPGQEGPSTRSTTAPDHDARFAWLAGRLLTEHPAGKDAGTPTVLARLMLDATEALGVDAAELCVFGDDPAHAELILSLGGAGGAEPHLGARPPYVELSEPLPGVYARQGPPPEMLAAIMETGELLLVADGAGDGPPLPSGFPVDGPRLGCPVPGSEQPCGAIILARDAGAAAFTPTDAALVAALAGQVALRVERDRLDRAGEVHQRREMGLAQLAETCMSTGSLTRVMESGLDLIHGVLGADGSRIWTLDAGTRDLRLGAMRGILGTVGELTIPMSRTAPLPVQAVINGEPVVLDDPASIRASLVDSTAQHAGFTSAVAFPLIAHDRTYGALTFFLRRASRVRADDLRFVKSVSDLIAVACATYESRIEREHTDAVFGTAITNSPVPLLMYEEGGRIIGSSRRVWEILGHDPRDVRDIDEWYLRAFPEAAYRESTRRRLETPKPRGPGATSAGDVEVTCLDGSVRVWTLMHDVVTHPDRPTQHFLAALDVTEERQAQADLRQATKMEAVGRLAGGIAHDFNNLLTVISGYVDIALSRLTEDHAVTKPLGEIALASEKASQLTEKLLAFSRQRKPEPRALDLGNVVTNLMSMVRPLIGEGIEVELSFEPRVPPVHIDRGSIEQVLMNMFVNARDAIGGQGRITVRTVSVPHGELPPVVGGPPVVGPHTLLLMSDTGSGMPPEVLSRIFEPFFTTKEPGVGTGLGLAGAYATVSQSGGDMRVVSAVGRGSSFGILLPAVAGVATRVEQAPSDAPPRGDETILVVEDREQVRNLAAAILEALGYKVLTAENGVDALEKAQAHTEPLHLLLTDVIMPQMGGVELASHLTQVRPDIAVVFMSGYPGKDLTASALPVSDRHVLRKPFTSSVLGHRVRAALDAGPGISAPPAH